MLTDRCARRIPYLTGLLPRMQRLQRELATADAEKKAYLMPVGGSSVCGLWGYIAGFQELLEQGLAEDYDDIVLAVGSGGTACGYVNTHTRIQKACVRAQRRACAMHADRPV